MKLFIRTDAGGVLGTGHVMRMLALAQAYSARGGRVVFITMLCPAALIERILDEGFEHHSLSSQSADLLGSEQDATETLDFINASGGGRLVTDGYHFGIHYQDKIAEHGVKLMCVDDHGYSEEWNCEAVLNQNLDAEVKARHFYPESSTHLLLGIDYCLLRKEFLENYSSKKSWAEVEKLLITLGGSDKDNATKKVLQLASSYTQRKLHIRVLLGADNPHLESLEALESPHQIEFLRNVRDMPAQYKWADGIISAGGSSCWEWLYYGLPGLLVEIADNQKPVLAGICAHGYASSLGHFQELISGNKQQNQTLLSKWLDHPEDCADEKKAHSAVDGLGAQRIASYLAGQEVLVRNTQQDQDAAFLFELANDESVRGVGFHTEPIPWETHIAWLERHLQSEQSYLFTIEDAEAHPVGQIRLHLVGENIWEIGVSIHPRGRKKGFAKIAIKQLLESNLCQFSSPQEIIATIKKDNVPSLRLFESLEFSPSTLDAEKVILTYTLK